MVQYFDAIYSKGPHFSFQHQCLKTADALIVVLIPLTSFPKKEDDFVQL